MNQWTTAWQQFLQDHPSLQIDFQPNGLQVPSQSPSSLAKDEPFWQQVQALYPRSAALINLNNGAVSSSPFMVEKAFTTYYQLINQIPSYYLFKFMEQGRGLIREGLAGLINCSSEEVAMLRNTTEALNNVIFGIPLHAGDEVVACKQDYSKAVASWKQRELREKIKVKWINLQGVGETDEQIIAKYVAAFTAHTKVVHLTHVINWNGQVLPVEQIITEAKKRNIEVLLDGAHSFGLLDTDVNRLGCHYFVTALHKWLSGPIPGALLFVKKEKIHELWPLASSAAPLSDNIRKFEELSIQLMPSIIALGFAIEFYLLIGRENKEERLRYLRRFWTLQLQHRESIHFKTPAEEERYCVIVNLSLAGWEPAELEKHLLDTYAIHVTAVTWENMKGIRITPNIYTSLNDLQKLVEALMQTAHTKHKHQELNEALK